MEQIVVETLIAAATLWHALTFTRNKESFKGSPTEIVLNALYVDGCLYFLVRWSFFVPPDDEH